MQTDAKGDRGSAGPQGDKGNTGGVGPEGAKGDTGAKGNTGSTGAQGGTGPQGPAGASGGTAQGTLAGWCYFQGGECAGAYFPAYCKNQSSCSCQAGYTLIGWSPTFYCMKR
jgi:hypothetical protein